LKLAEFFGGIGQKALKEYGISVLNFWTFCPLMLISTGTWSLRDSTSNVLEGRKVGAITHAPLQAECQ
jgi:hypothetical protein